ncbi:MAG: sigma-70 family RNA polymerase sigma factor [Proteobacteria bacterium]|nr:sigma-70 family RNA polymerase sigma factor [Pseudomonadota bacterium]
MHAEGEAEDPGLTQAAAAPNLSPADQALISRLRARDEAAFVELLERFQGPLLRLASAFVASRAVAEEVVQETWVAVLDGLERFEGRSSLKTWIFRILSNRARTRGAREGRSLPFSAFDAVDEEGEPAVDPQRFDANGHWSRGPRRWEDETPERLLLRHAALERLEQALKELPPQQCAVVSLRDLEGCDSDEVCSVLGVSETNQRVLLHRARAKLRGALETYYDGSNT